MNGEVYFCGNCRRQQAANANNISCKSCGSRTVSWYTNNETEADAIRKWKNANGKR